MTSGDDYPIGETWVFDIGVAQIEHHILSATRFEFHVLTGPRAGERGSMNFEATGVRPGLWLVSWQEPDRSTVVHLEDYAHDTFISCLTTPERQFLRFAGKMWRKAP